MKRRELLKLVIGIVVKIQEISGRKVPSTISERTVPIGGLPGFDSLNGLELTMMLPDGIVWGKENLCVSEDGRRPLSVGEIAERLLHVQKRSK